HAYLDTLNWADKKIAAQVEEVVEKNGALGPRQIMEAFIDKIVELNKEILVHTAKDETEDKDHGPKEDGNDGVVESDDDEDEKFESPWTHFQGLGLEPSVPSYLRVTGKVQNQCFSKKETEMHLNDVWIAKETYEEEALEELRGKNGGDMQVDRVEGIDTSGVTPGKIHLKDFFGIYLEQKFKTTSRAVEFAYNFLDSLKKYDFDTDCKLFLMIMHGELAEEIRHDQLTLLNTLVDEFQREESTIRQPVEGRLPVDSFMRAIRRVIPTKGEHALRRLQKALDLEIKGKKYVLYNEILEEDEQGNQGRFCETLRMQHVTECTTFSNHVMEVIDQFAEEDDSNEDHPSGVPSLTLGAAGDLKEKMMTIHRFRDALVFADPDNPRAGVNRLLARGCAVSVEEMLLMEGRMVQVNVESFKLNLKMGLLKKSYPSGGGGDQGRGKIQF
ncbi:Tsnaxip1, partial [Symbiodinium microadriaticum]